MYEILKLLLFLLPEELAHQLGIFAVQMIGIAHRFGLWSKPSWSRDHRLQCDTPFGKVDSPIGLAAGLDKNAQALWGWQALGFSFAEVGTATPLPQPGNPKPRLFRYVGLQAIVNRMGFNNDGAAIIARRVARAKKQGLRIKVGGNIGKNKETPIEAAPLDYMRAAAALAPHVDYLVINVSSPNTEGLRGLQGVKSLDRILESVRTVAPAIPLYIKVAPDDFETYMDGVLTVSRSHRCAGVICGNTLANHAAAEGVGPLKLLSLPQGGLSGNPIFKRNLELLESYVRQAGALHYIGVGGIMSGTNALQYLQAGAGLIQVYSGFIFKGTVLLREIALSISEGSRPGESHPQ